MLEMRNIIPPLAPMSRRNHAPPALYASLLFVAVQIRPKFSTVYAAQFRAAPAWTTGNRISANWRREATQVADWLSHASGKPYRDVLIINDLLASFCNFMVPCT